MGTGRWFWACGLCLLVLSCQDYFPPDVSGEDRPASELYRGRDGGEKPRPQPDARRPREPSAPEPAPSERREAPTEPTTPEPSPPERAPDQPKSGASHWWRDAVIYQLMLRSFQDSDGDGIGDLKGLIQRLDYLNDGDPKTTQDLGVTAIWLLPIFEAHSPHGYDTLNYEKIQPEYGSLQDFKTLTREAHKRGIRIILDMVFNHTSDLHPWFRDSQSSTTSARRSWYVWRDKDPGWQQPWGGGRAWHALGGHFYYGIFWKGMPDLNFRHPPVRKEIQRISRFWLSQGVDGFRFDAARYLIEGSAQHLQGDQPETHGFWREYRSQIKGISKQVMLVGEVWTDLPKLLPYCKGDEFDLVFHFPLAEAIYHSINGRQSSILWRALEASYKMPFGCWAPFLSNHDQQRIFSRFKQDPADMAAAAWLLLTLPGTPFIYYGEELGTLQGTAHKGYDTRAPMAWDQTPKAGFTTGTPWHPLPPQHEKASVAQQQYDASSLLSLYRKLIRARRSYKALRTGSFSPLLLDGRGVSAVVAFIRIHEKQRLAVVVNVGKQPIQQMKLLFSFDVKRLKPLLTRGNLQLHPASSSPRSHVIDLAQGSAAILDLGSP